MTDRRGLAPPQIIEPVEFRPSGIGARRTPSAGRWFAFTALLLAVIAIAAITWSALTLQRVEIDVTPTPDRLGLVGPRPRLEIVDSWLVRRGDYTVRATLEGYHALDERISVRPEQDNRFEFELRPLPGLVTVIANSSVDGAELVGATVSVDGDPIGRTPLHDAEVEPGTRIVRVTHERYVTQELEIGVQGYHLPERFELALRPDWSDVSVDSMPRGAQVRLDGIPVATTPCTIEVRSGMRAIEVGAQGYESWQAHLEIIAGQPVTLDPIMLSRIKGRLVVETVPPGALILVGGEYVGAAPLQIGVAPDEEILVQAAMDGHRPAQETVRVDSAGEHHLRLELTPELGLVRLSVLPEDALVSIDEGPPTPAGAEIALLAVEHTLEFTREGFEPATRTIRPRPGITQRLVVELQRTAPPRTFVASNGYQLVRIDAASFTMGTSRREQGRRSNETLRKIILERPFLMGVREVTNAEFLQFDPDHQSGMAEHVALDDGDRPVVRVSWDEAARYCNWLSARDGLPAAYAPAGDSMRALNPPTIGYRLPTEAEWARVARLDAGEVPRQYPWGDQYPPPNGAGNFADKSAASLVPRWLEGYDDGFAGPAPVASFKPNALGLHDIGGNVSEWCHDYYATYTYDPSDSSVDPIGPESGRHHVVRGSSWRQFSMTTLRCAYRDYSDESRDDLGFRICRYLEEREAPR